MKSIKILILIILLFCNIKVSYSQFREYGTIEPFDDSHSDQSFSNFINELKTAVNNKDVQYIYDMLDEQISFSFGDEGPGKRAFRDFWKLDEPNSDFWEAFSSTLSLGITRCRINCNFAVFEFPYYQSASLFDNIEDAYSVLIITSPNAGVHSSPDINSELLTNLRYKVINYSAYDNGWYTVSWKGNKKGYIKDTDARALIDLRGGFKQSGDKWKLTYFIAGD